MSDNESLADAAWATELLSEQDWLELQSTGAAISEGREVFLLQIVKYVSEAKALVEAYAAVNNEGATMEQCEMLNSFVYEVIAAFYSMCVNAKVVDEGFWKEPEN